MQDTFLTDSICKKVTFTLEEDETTERVKTFQPILTKEFEQNELRQISSQTEIKLHENGKEITIVIGRLR